MSRKIVLLSDGTGNSAAKVWRTNVWRTFEALDLSGNDQVALYDDGVGTSKFKPLAVLGGAFGFGLRRNVIALYKFACRNYRDANDELFGFGFSRGAFTIRIVMGLIDSQGLIKADNEAELDSLAKAAYRAYRRDRYKGQLRLERPYQWVRNKFGPHYPPPNVRKPVRIAFIGVWDTVAAYGLPVDEMTRGVHKYLWPIELPGNELSESVDRACQALALDEERTTFHPQLWHEPADNKARDIKSADSEAADNEAVEAAPNAPEIEPGRRRFIKGERISQVWFAGVHTNVGGGYPDDSLAYIPFVWMITEAQRCGLKFKSDAAKPPRPVADPDTFKNAISKRDKDGRLYDPRKGLGGYYRYGPRKLVPFFYPEAKKKEDDEVEVQRAKIHESVFKRIENSAQAYAPIGLPPLYDVVKDDGEIVTPDQYGFESNARAADRAQAQEHVWNEVWKRRLIYFGSVGATVWLLAFPLISGSRRVDEFTNPFRWISDIIRSAGAFLPNVASTWIDGYARAPRSTVLLIGLVIFFIVWGARLASRISNRMGAIWKRLGSAPSGLPTDRIYALRSDPRYIAFHEGLKQRWAPIFFAIMFVYLGLSIVSHLFYNIQDVAGFACKDSESDPAIKKPTLLKVGVPHSVDFKVSKDFKTSEFCIPTGILLKKGARYIVSVDELEPWSDLGIKVPTGGFSPKDPPAWYQRIFLSLGLPLRREWFHDWFRIGLRYGRVGGEEVFLEPDPDDPKIQSPLKPTRDGELFVFVNDAVIGIPGLYDLLYRNNRGSARLTVTRTK
jgi:uncharacterized protein (DUF2235 family)